MGRSSLRIGSRAVDELEACDVVIFESDRLVRTCSKTCGDVAAKPDLARLVIGSDFCHHSQVIGLVSSRLKSASALHVLLLLLQAEHASCSDNGGWTWKCERLEDLRVSNRDSGFSIRFFLLLLSEKLCLILLMLNPVGSILGASEDH